MPDISTVSNIATNTAHIAANTEIVQHLSDTFKIVGPFVLSIVGLLVWAWKRLEATQDKLEAAFVKHVEENDKLHDKLFDVIRKRDERLAVMHETIEKIKIHHQHQHNEEIK